MSTSKLRGDWKRLRLKALGYRVAVIRGEELEAGVDDLSTRLSA